MVNTVPIYIKNDQLGERRKSKNKAMLRRVKEIEKMQHSDTKGMWKELKRLANWKDKASLPESSWMTTAVKFGEKKPRKSGKRLFVFLTKI